MPKTSSSDATPVRSAQRMLGILSWFNLEHPSGRIGDIAVDLGLAPSTVRRLVSTLEQHRYLALDESTGRYRLHVEVVRLAAVAVTTNDVVRAATPVLDLLMKELGETLILNVLDGSLVVHLTVRQSAHQFSIYPPAGRRYNAYEGGASGMVLLAWLEESELDELLPSEDRWRAYAGTKTFTREEFVANLAEVQRDGFAVNDGVTDPDLWSIATPIRDHTGRVVAALSSACRRSSMTAARKKHFAKALVDATNDISLRLCFDTTANSGTVGSGGRAS